MHVNQLRQELKALLDSIDLKAEIPSDMLRMQQLVIQQSRVRKAIKLVTGLYRVRYFSQIVLSDDLVALNAQTPELKQCQEDLDSMSLLFSKDASGNSLFVKRQIELQVHLSQMLEAKAGNSCCLFVQIVFIFPRGEIYGAIVGGMLLGNGSVFLFPNIVTVFKELL